MDISECVDVKIFWKETEAFLQGNVAENNMIIGLVDREINMPGSLQKLHMLIVRSEGKIVLATFQARDREHFAVLFSVDHSENFAATRAALTSLSRRVDSISQYGFISSEPQAAVITNYFEKSDLPKFKLFAALYTYRLTELNEKYIESLHNATGSMRLAKADDPEEFNLLHKMLCDFSVEMKFNPVHAEGWLRRLISTRKFWLWIDSNGTAVSFAGINRELPTASAIAPVYTPTEYRGKGYASRLVGELSRLILKTKGMAILNTDVQNPKSNFVYQSLGYVRVCKEVHYKALEQNSIQVVQFTNANRFWECSRLFLERSTAENNLTIGLLDREIKKPGSFSQLLMYTVVDTGRNIVVMTAMQTQRDGTWMAMIFAHDVSADLKPTKALLEHFKNEKMLDRIVQCGFRSSEAQATEVLSLLAAESKAQLLLKKALWIYRLTELNEQYVRSVASSTGRMRLVNTEDTAETAKVKQWLTQFSLEVGETPTHVESWYQQMTQQRKLWVWEESSEIVCLVGSTRELPAAATVGPVFTPKEHRKKGHASRLVAQVSRLILETKGMAILYADSANPTSNHIYQSLGYQKVCTEVYYK